MTRANFQFRFIGILFFFISCFFQSSVYAERLLFVPSLNELENTLPTQPKNRLAALQDQLTSKSGVPLASSLLLLARHSFNDNDYPSALNYINQSIELFLTNDSPLELANSYYIRAVITSIGLREYPKSVAQYEQVLQIKPSTEQASLALLHTKTYQKLGSLLMFLKKPDKAKNYILKAISSAEAIREIDIEVDARLDLAKYYLSQQDTAHAEEVLMLANKLSTNASSKYLPKVLIQISRFYRKVRSYELAIKYGEKAVKSIKESQDLVQLAWAHNNLAIAYEESGNLNMALVQYLNALNNAKKKQSVFVALAQNNIGLIYAEQLKYDDSINYLNLANAMFRAIDHPYYLMHNNLSLGTTHIELAQFEKAIEYLTQALETASVRKELTVQEDAHRKLTMAYAQISEFKLANQHNQSLNDSLQQKIKALESAQAQQQTEFKNRQQNRWQQLALDREVNISLLNQQIATTKTRFEVVSAALFVIALILLLTLLIGWRFIKKKSQTIAQYRAHSSISLPVLNMGESLTPTFNEHFLNKQYLLTIRLPLATSFNRYFNHEQAHQMHQQWLVNLPRALESKVFCLNDSTIVCAVSNDMETSQELFKSVIEQINNSAPSLCQELIKTQYPIKIGAASLYPFQQHPNENEASNTLNLALTMLAGIEADGSTSSSHHWLLASSKEYSQSSIFNFSSRNEWVYSIKNNLITLESDGHFATDWDKITFQNKSE